MTADEKWMQLAIAEARKGVGLTSPNPPVGAVIVKDNKLLGQGWHTQAGKPHAEREAIADTLRRHTPEELSGATIYITLEPCSSHGRTPPCTEAITTAGVVRVVYGAEDPNPDHAGRAQTLLESMHIAVTTGIAKAECQSLIRAFAKKQSTGLPWVTLKSAMSLDGRITRPPGESQWLTSPESRAYVQQLRFESDAIVTGGNTLRIDDPALTLRSIAAQQLRQKQQPLRMVITRGNRAALPETAQLFNDAYSDRTLVQENGDLMAAMKSLADADCNSILVEAGGTLMAAFLEAGLADEVALFYAPMLGGGPDAAFAGLPNETHLHDQEYTRIGNDILLRALITPPVL